VPLTRADFSRDQRIVYDDLLDWVAARGTTLTMGGYAGTGKTSLLGVFAKAMRDAHKCVAFVAYTGRASSVLRRKLAEAGVETTSRVRRTNEDADEGLDAYFDGNLGVRSGPPLCSTIHKLLYRPVIDPQTEELKGWVKRSKLDRQYDLVIVDEASMVSDDILADIRIHGAPLLAVGDHGQLPPVAATGSLMKNPDLRLERIHRQAEGNPIIALAHHVREGGPLWAFEPPGGSTAIEVRSRGEVSVAMRYAYRDHPNPLDVGVLCWTNRMRCKLNGLAREVLGLRGPPKDGDVVIALKNKPPVFNGMRGVLHGDSIGGAVPWMIHADVEFPDEGIPTSSYDLCAAQFFREKVFDSVEEMQARGMQVYSMTAAGDFYDMGYALTVHKCVDPTTLIETPEGLVRAGELKSTGVVATPTGSAKYKNLVQYDAGRMLEIITEDGYSLRVTEDHGVDVWNATRGYVKQYASQIRPGDVVRLKLGATFATGDSERLLPPARPQDVRARIFELPKTCRATEAEFFGLMVADGTVYAKGFRLAKRHVDVADRFDSLCRTLFGAVPSRFFKLNAHHVEVSSALIADWLRDVGGMAPNAKGIPACVLAAPLDIQAAFLRGLFEDATVNVTASGRLDHVEFHSVFEDLRRVVRVMLLRFGIVCGTTPNRSESLYIYGGYAKRFGDLIGFISKYKQGRLDESEVGGGTRYTFPLLASEMSLSTTGRPEIQRHRATGKQFDDRRPFHHSAVAEVRRYVGKSVCVEVPTGHQFLQDGFCGWNSQGSQFPTVLVYLDRPEKPEDEDYRRWAYTAITRASERLVILR
jgi:intein/homing endonuclease